MRVKTFTRIECVWEVDEKEISRLRYKGCEVYKYFQDPKKARVDGRRPKMERTSEGWRTFLGAFDSIDEARLYYPGASTV